MAIILNFASRCGPVERMLAGGVRGAGFDFVDEIITRSPVTIHVTQRHVGAAETAMMGIDLGWWRSRAEDFERSRKGTILANLFPLSWLRFGLDGGFILGGTSFTGLMIWVIMVILVMLEK